MAGVTKAQVTELQEKIDELQLEIDRQSEYIGLLERQSADAINDAETTALVEKEELRQFKKQIDDLFYYAGIGILSTKDFFFQLSELLNIPQKVIETFLIKPYWEVTNDRQNYSRGL